MARDSQSPRDTHSILSSKESIRMRARADNLEWDARSLDGIGILGMKSQAKARKAKIVRLWIKVQEEEVLSEIENTKARDADHRETTSEGRKNYPRWVCSWWKGNKTVTRYVGSCSRKDQQDALEKAKRLNAGSPGAGDFKDEI